MSYLGRSAKLSLKAQEKVSFLATAGQTVKTGLSYTPSFIEVYVNGVLLTDTTDFTATNGNSVTFTVALLLNDEVTVISLKTFTVADHYNKTEADTLLSAKATNTAVALKSTIASPSFTGKVGIGSSSPVRQLEIKDDGTLGQAIVGIIADAGDPAGIFMGTTSNNNVGGIRYFTDTNKLTLRANDEDRLLIDSAGYVTTPYQPAFNAGMSSDQDLTGGAGTILFNYVSGHHFNTGNHYSTSTGRFTAPVAGTYHFHILVLYEQVVDGTNMADQFYVYKNGVNTAYAHRRAEYVAGTTGNGGYYSDWATVTLKLAVNEYVQIHSKAARVHGNADFTYFTGHLIG